MSPPRASISLTRLPFAKPPMAGLQDIRPTASRCIVTRATRTPPRAQTRAASAPAWPPPMTMTSKPGLTVPRGTSLADAKFCEDLVENLVAREGAGEDAEGVCGAVEIDD